MKKLVKLTILSPVYIGDEKRELSQVEFLEQNSFIHIFSEDKLIRVLKEKGMIRDFLNYLEQQSYPSLREYWWHIPPGERNSILKEVTIRKIKTSVSRVRNLQLHISDPVTSLPYIPGSSIKGSLRSALLYYFVSENTNPFIEVFEKLIKERNLKNRKQIGTQIDGYYFQSNNIKGKNRVKKGGNTDLMRLVKVSDAFVRQEHRSNQISEVVRVKIISLNNNGGYHFSKNRNSDIEIFVEVIKPGTELIFEIDIDEFLKELIEIKGHSKEKYQYDQMD
ncbi:MAG TPA: type III-A CRISPR-associated RAMP protein Csm5, partial [Clostridiaceae bacterium]|nr:type III-A CRISPR-associated RAMP protein Csm5 [Clostridiaceae bacterium]